MYIKQTNGIALQSQQLICEALFSLMEHYSYKDITVTQICQEASLVRKTFYRNFETKEDILHFRIDQMFEEFYLQLNPNKIEPYEAFYSCFRYFVEHKTFLQLIQKNNLFYIINEKVISYIKHAFFFAEITHITDIKTLEPYILRFISGTLCSILELWTQNGFNETPETLARLTERLLSHTL